MADDKRDDNNGEGREEEGDQTPLRPKNELPKPGASKPETAADDAAQTPAAGDEPEPPDAKAPEDAGDEASAPAAVGDEASAPAAAGDELEPPAQAPPAEQAPVGQLLPVSRDYVEDLLGELGEVAESSGLKSLHEEVVQDRIPALRAGRMSVVVLGEFNHGKSTVVNALLGEEILPTGITPTTSVITHLVHGEEPAAIVKPHQGGPAYDIDYKDTGDAIRHVEETGTEPEYVEISYPNELLGDNLVLVDTPGVNDISRQKVEITYGYVPKADVIIYVLDATQVLKKSEVTFIRDRLLKANRDRIIFVLGKVDALSEADVAEVEQYARERLAELIGPVELFAFSARQALAAHKAGRPLPDDFVAFREYLLGFLRENKAYILLDSALGGGLRIAGLLEQNLAIKKQGYLLEKADLEQRIQNVKAKLKESRQLIATNLDRIDEAIGGIAATARHNLHTFTEEFRETLPQQIDRAEAKDIKLYLSAWIQDSFKQWIEAEGTRVADKLEELAEEVIEITNESMRETVNALRDELGLHDKLDLEVDTIAYDVSVFALGALGLGMLFANVLVGGLLTLATPVLAFIFKGKVDEKIKERARDEGLKVVDRASAEIEEELLRVIYDYGERLKTFVEDAGDRLYRQVDEALAQVQREVGSKRDRKELAAEVDERLQAVRRVGRVMKSTRQQLAEAAE